MRLTRESLGSWVESVTLDDPLPHLRVLSHGRDLLGTTFPNLREMPTQGSHDPGCFRFVLDTLQPDIPSDKTDDDLASIARSVIDAGRKYRREVGIELDASIEPEIGSRSEPDSDFGHASLIRLHDGRGIPTVGPGGYVTFGRQAHTIMGTSSIRPFVEDYDPRPWLDINLLIDALAGLLDANLQFDPTFGYYEKTWMERQEVITPVHAFVIEGDSSEYPLKREITVPATLRR